MNNEAKKRLLDALEACRAIQQFTAGSNFVSYTTDSMRRAAVERKFEILGGSVESRRGIRARVDRAPSRRPAHHRNEERIIHGYDAVDDEIVWDTVQGKIPSLLEQLSALLSDEGGNL